MRVFVVLIVLLAAPALAAAPPTSSMLPQSGPDIPAATAAATVTVLEDEHWHHSSGLRWRLIQVPVAADGEWDRIVLEYRQYNSRDPAQQDPWDRSCSAWIEGAEVLRCTTPRTDMTLTKDITAFASLLPSGGEARAGANTGSYNQAQYYRGGQFVTMKLHFYDDEPTAAATPVATSVVAPFYSRGICANATPTTTTAIFPDEPATSGSIEVTLSSHGGEEFWWQGGGSREFRVIVDGRIIAEVEPMPYTYAFQGFYGEGYGLHPVMWWSAHQALDIAGIHTGVGEIPPYQMTLPASTLAALTGAKDVTIGGVGGGCVWPMSVTFLLD